MWINKSPQHLGASNTVSAQKSEPLGACGSGLLLAKGASSSEGGILPVSLEGGLGSMLHGPPHGGTGGSCRILSAVLREAGREGSSQEGARPRQPQAVVRGMPGSGSNGGAQQWVLEGECPVVGPGGLPGGGSWEGAQWWVLGGECPAVDPGVLSGGGSWREGAQWWVLGKGVPGSGSWEGDWWWVLKDRHLAVGIGGSLGDGSWWGNLAVGLGGTQFWVLGVGPGSGSRGKGYLVGTGEAPSGGSSGTGGCPAVGSGGWGHLQWVLAGRLAVGFGGKWLAVVGVPGGGS